jgi:DNA-directed RNA polymerase specialized sigma24 family protein
MTKVKDLSYDIEQLYIEGYSPKTIAMMLECPIDMVYEWIEQVNVEWDEAFLREELSPFETINS